MLKKPFLYATTLALCGSTTLQAVDQFVEAKAAYLYPISERYREVYGTGGIYGLEYTTQFYKRLYGWASADYFHIDGKSSRGHSTESTLVPLAFGLKAVIPYKRTDFYIGLGPTFTYIHFTDNSPFVIRHSSKWGYGVIAKAGALFNFKKHFFLDLFADYSYLRDRFHNTNHDRVIRPHMDLSNWSIGAGLGIRWGRPVQKREASKTKALQEKKSYPKTKAQKRWGPPQK